VGVRAVLLAGTSGGGKTTLVTGFVERLLAQSYQCCILDPEGDYEGIAGAISLGGAGRTPNLDQIAEAVKAGGNVVISYWPSRKQIDRRTRNGFSLASTMYMFPSDDHTGFSSMKHTMRCRYHPTRLRRSTLAQVCS
jgi:thymidylate kinase